MSGFSEQISPDTFMSTLNDCQFLKQSFCYLFMFFQSYVNHCVLRQLHLITFCQVDFLNLFDVHVTTSQKSEYSFLGNSKVDTTKVIPDTL